MKINFIKKGLVKRLATGLIVILLTVLCFFSVRNKISRVEIDFLDVGQGDASLLKLPNNKIVLIDGGPDNLVLRRLGENLPFYKRKIDLIILSHFHDDHLIGLIEIIRRYEVGSIIYMRGMESSGIFQTFLKEAKERKINLVSLENEANIKYSEKCLLKILNPLVLGVKEDNNNSLITKIDCSPLSALFTGDSNYKVEEALLKTGQVWSAKILKASHHGSKTANSELFLRSVNPDILVISVGASNRFGHPSAEILERVRQLGIKIKRTDFEGTIEIYGSQ
jgi:competence protein ComEC